MSGPAPYGEYPSHGPAAYPERGPAAPTPPVAAGRLWATGAATAVVAALAAVVVTLLMRGVLDVPVFAPRRAGVWGDATTGYLAACAVGAALVATGLLHLLLVTVARPRAFFVWIAALVTVVFVLMPFTTSLSTATQLASAAVFLVIGAVITGLLSAVSTSVGSARPHAS
ncbi:DUF6069 family protein [Streptomyces sp. NPDC001691]|uniref:DUF6069 family protein n=1 Tax=unclassified Streptomyces TaxID=2593676 RepID=UPI000DEB0400|nr:DUF6069 family protein [Streptomyces sp. SDr-06]RCH66756.1 hypothetical protein DT019_21770 [Streptomyces sp. SDr-06]